MFIINYHLSIIKYCVSLQSIKHFNISKRETAIRAFSSMKTRRKSLKLQAGTISCWHLRDAERRKC